MDHTIAIGRIVHYRLESGPGQGSYRPAIIVRVWSDQPTEQTAVQLQVFTDSNQAGNSNDRIPCPLWATSRVHGTGLGQYLWPDEEKPALGA